MSHLMPVSCPRGAPVPAAEGLVSCADGRDAGRSFVQAVAAAQAGVSVIQPNIGRLHDWYVKHPGFPRNPKVRPYHPLSLCCACCLHPRCSDGRAGLLSRYAGVDVHMQYSTAFGDVLYIFVTGVFAIASPTSVTVGGSAHNRRPCGSSQHTCHLWWCKWATACLVAMV